MEVYFLIEEEFEKLYTNQNDFERDIREFPFLKKYLSEASQYFAHRGSFLVLTNVIDSVCKRSLEVENNVYCLFQRKFIGRKEVDQLHESNVFTILRNLYKFQTKITS